MAWLLWLAPIIAIAGIVWYTRRKIAAREAASAERLKAFLGKSAAAGAAVRSGPAAFPATAPVPAPTPQTKAPLADYVVRERMLTPPQAVLYYLLKNHLPDHQVLVHVSLTAFIDAASSSGFERTAQQRRLAAAIVDFVVCDKSFKAVAVVQCGAHEGDVAFARACCESAALRWVEVSPGALPRREEVRQRVLGV